MNTYLQGSPEHFLSTVKPIHLKDTDINLVAQAREILLAALMPVDQNRIVYFDTDPNVQTAAVLTTEIQRYKLNLFLNSQYSMLAGDISVHRGYCLTSGPIDQWIKMFQTYHAPTLVRLGLPAGYHA